jgi:hypothetical protein
VSDTAELSPKEANRTQSAARARLARRQDRPAKQLSPEEANRRAAQRAASLKLNEEKVAWRVKEWAASVGLGQTKVFALIRDNRIRAAMIDGRRLILTSPADFVKSLPRG